MRIRREAFPFIWLNPGPVGFRIARSGDPSVVRSRRLLGLAERALEGRQDVIDSFLSGRAPPGQAQNFSKSERGVLIRLWRTV